MSGRAKLEHAIGETARAHAQRQQTVMRGSVTVAKPLTVQPFGYGHELTLADDFDLSAWMTLYQAIVGLKTDDMVLMVREDSWLVFDAVPDQGVDVTAKFRKAWS